MFQNSNIRLLDANSKFCHMFGYRDTVILIMAYIYSIKSEWPSIFSDLNQYVSVTRNHTSSSW